MTLVMDILCLLIWIIQLVIGISNVITGEPVNTIVFFGAILVCIIFYIGNIVEDILSK